MLIILTEDTGSGYVFFQQVAEIFKGRAIEVYNSAYGSKTHTGGITTIEDTVKSLWKDRKINAGDKVFFAIDRIIKSDRNNTDDEPQIQVYDRCKQYLRKRKIESMHGNYICFEELILSFQDLYHYCIPVKFLMNTRDAKKKYYIDIYVRYKALFTKHYMSENYIAGLYRLFRREMQKGNTLEDCLAEMLHYITATDKYSAFRITKAELGNCWLLNCSEARKKIHNYAERKLCAYCYPIEHRVCKHPSSHRSRLMYMIERSRTKEILQELGLYTIFVNIRKKAEA